MRGASCKAGRTLALKWERQTTRKLGLGSAAAVLRSAIRDHIRSSVSDLRRWAPCSLLPWSSHGLRRFRFGRAPTACECECWYRALNADARAEACSPCLRFRGNEWTQGPVLAKRDGLLTIII
jgi:hypothetical protein